MAGEDIILRLGLDTLGFDAKARSTLKQVAGLAAGATALAFGLSKAKDALLKYTEAANVQARADAQLAGLLEANNIALSKERVAAFAAARQAATNYGDETTMAMLGTLAPMRLSAREMEGLTIAAQDLAAMTGKEAEREIKKFTAALTSGTATGLEPYIGALDDAEKAAFKAGTASERAAILIEQANDTIGGSAARNRDPLVQLRNALGDLDQAIGALVSEDTNGALDWLTTRIVELTTWLSDNGPALRSFFIDTAADLGTFAGRALEAAKSMSPLIVAYTALAKLRSGDVVGALADMSPGGLVARLIADATRGVGTAPRAATDDGTGLSFTVDDLYGPRRSPGARSRPTTTTGGGADGFDLEIGTARIYGAGAAPTPGRSVAGELAGGAMLGGTTDTLRAQRAEVEAQLEAYDAAVRGLERWREAWGAWQDVAIGATHAIGDALWTLATDQEATFGAVVAQLGRQLGQMLLNLGIGELWRAGFEAISLDPRAAPRAAMAAAAIGVGLGLGAVSAAAMPPAAAPADRAPTGGAAGGGGGRSGGGGGYTIVINNTYGAIGPSPQEQARELQRVLIAGRRAGILAGA